MLYLETQFLKTKKNYIPTYDHRSSLQITRRVHLSWFLDQHKERQTLLQNVLGSQYCIFQHYQIEHRLDSTCHR